MMTAIKSSPALRATPTTSNGISGAGQRVGVVYGAERRDALVSTVADIGDKTLLICVWCQGGEHGIDAITGLTVNDENPPAGTVIRHYLGVGDQPVDAGVQGHLGVADNLVSTHNGHTIALAYSVIELPDSVGFPRIAATIRGLKVTDPRTGVVAWSDNPALCAADLIESAVYGMGRAALNVAAAANYCDELVDGSRRRQLGGLSIGYDQEPARERIDQLREYAGCFVVAEGAGRKLIPRRAETPIETITNDDLNGEPGLSRGESGSEMSTAVRVNFTNTDSIPWRQNSVLAVLPGVNAGTLELVENVIDMPGTHSGKVAAREANERLNRIKHGGLDLTLPLFSEQLQRQPGDVIRVEIPEIHGDFRILPFDAEDDAGFYSVNLTQESPLIYADDSNFIELLPMPAVPRQDSVAEPSIGGVTSGNGVYIEGGDGTIHNRIRVDLSVPADPRNFRGYEIRFRKAGSSSPWQDGQVTGYTAHLFPVQDGVSYEFEVRTLGRINNVVSNWVPGMETVSPKNVPPAACSSLDATVNASGQRRVGWSYGARPADFAGFEVQYDAAGNSYIDLLTGQANQRGLTQKQIVETGDMPAGNVTIRVRAVDTSGAASDWIYKAENFGQDPDGTWYDVDQRIAAEQAKNQNQDNNTIPTADNKGQTGINNAYQEHLRNNGHDGKFNVNDGDWSWQKYTKNSNYDGKNSSYDSKWSYQEGTKNPYFDGYNPRINSADNKGQTGINNAYQEHLRNNDHDGKNSSYDSKWSYQEGTKNPYFDGYNPRINAAHNTGQSGVDAAGVEAGRNNGQDGTLNFHEFTKIPAADAKGQQGIDAAGNAQGTANAANSIANNAKVTADQALQDARFGVVTVSRVQASNLNQLAPTFSASGGTMSQTGDFLSSNGFRVTSSGVAYARDLYVWGDWKKRTRTGCRPDFIGYKKIDDVVAGVCG